MMSALRKRKYPQLSVDEKIAYIRRLKTGETLRTVASEAGVDVRTVHRWMKDVDKLEECAKSLPQPVKRKRLRAPANPLLDEAVKTWVEERRQQGMPVTGPIIRQKALTLNKELGGSVFFRASEGWLNRWRRSNAVRSSPVSDERSSADEFAGEIETQPPIFVKTEVLQHCPIYDEDGSLSYRMVPVAAFSPEHEDEIEFEESKEHFADLLSSNADDSCEDPPAVGESEEPRELRNIPKNPLEIVEESEELPALRNIPKDPPEVSTNEISELTNSEIIEDWFKSEFIPQVTSFLLSRNLSQNTVVSVVNTASNIELFIEAIRVMLFSSNAISSEQPLDQETIGNLRNNYRHLFLSAAASTQELGGFLEAHVKSITMKHVIEWLEVAWKNASRSNITKSWRPLMSQDQSDRLESNAAEFPRQILRFLRFSPKSSIYTNMSLVDGENCLAPSAMPNDGTVDKIDATDKDVDQSNSLQNHEKTVFNVESNTDKENVNSSIGSVSQSASREDLRTERVTPDRVVSSIDLVLDFFVENNSLTSEEMNLLLSLRNKATSFRNKKKIYLFMNKLKEINNCPERNSNYRKN